MSKYMILCLQWPLLLLLLLHPPLSLSQLQLSPHESYRDFIPLSAGNLSTALQDNEAWILHLHSDQIFAEFKRLAASVRGLIRFGLISRDDTEAVAQLKFDVKSNEFRALAFGSAASKQRKFLDTVVFADALQFASDSVPADKLTMLKDKSQLKKLLSQAIMAKPSQFTAIFTIRDATPTLLQKVISQKLSRNFAFGIVPHAADADALSNVGLGGVKWPVPGLSVLTVQPSGSVQSARMNEKNKPWDKVDFPEILRFLIEFNRQFRPQLPGDNQSSDKRVLYMTDVLQHERLVFDIRDAQSQVVQGADDIKQEL